MGLSFFLEVLLKMYQILLSTNKRNKEFTTNFEGKLLCVPFALLPFNCFEMYYWNLNVIFNKNACNLVS
jgi:hypothetical protein